MIDTTAARTAMVDCQVRPSDVTRYAIIDAMMWAPRERFVPRARQDVAYADADIPLGEGRALMSARVFAKMLEVSGVGSRDLVLDLAPGLGYSTAVLARLAEAVVAIEPNEAMRNAARSTLEDLEVDNAVVSDGDLRAGDPAHGPYDLIFLNGSVEDIPDALTTQLKDGGRLVMIHRQGTVEQCRVLVRAGDAIADRYAFDASAPALDEFAREAAFSF